MRFYLRIAMLGPLCALAFPMSAPLGAQTTVSGVTSREVVQSLPTAEVERLQAALLRLAQNPQDIGALVEAGDASLGVDDLDAALGFYGRALSLSPENARAKLGTASVYLRSRRPVEALQMFAEAEKAGASTDAILSDWGLAQDLVGNSALAQQSYRTVLATRPDDDTRRRLAISLAISGDRPGFEAALLPLLGQKDMAAYRARAFGLAILGETDEAASLAGQLMPTDLASRMVPYLAFMPRLTPAQQAAAANLGIFPRAAEIGRDDPRIARYASSGDDVAVNAANRLAPRGKPLGQSSARSGSATVAPPKATPAPPTANPTPPKESRLTQVSRAQTTASTSVSEAFNGLVGPAVVQARPPAGAVDVTAIDIPRESRQKAEPKPPSHPSRNWVQLATGRDRDALKFDWRRMVRRAPDLLDDSKAYVTTWGQANRLLTGPFSSRDAARELVQSLRAQGFDSFTYVSPDGEEIVELK